MPKQYLQYMEEVNPDAPSEEEGGGVEEEVEGIAEDLNVNLPKVNLPLPIKLIVLFTLVGGLSIVGSVFVNIFDPSSASLGLYVLRIVAGVLFIIIAYGMIKRKRWSVWLYGCLVIIGLFVNPLFSILPAAIVVYLYFNHRHFSPSIFDNFVNWLVEKIGSNFRDKKDEMSETGGS